MRIIRQDSNSNSFYEKLSYPRYQNRNITVWMVLLNCQNKQGWTKAQHTAILIHFRSGPIVSPCVLLPNSIHGNISVNKHSVHPT